METPPNRSRRALAASTSRGTQWMAAMACALAACGSPADPDDASIRDGGPRADAAGVDGGGVDGGGVDGGGIDAGATFDAGGAIDAGSADGGPPPTCPPPGSTTADSTVPGAIETPHPTLRNVAITWAITGDADDDGVVSVRYRRAGTGAWREAMPLRRVPAGSGSGFSWSDRHAGSIFDLEPDTEYELELFLDDPDGGCAVETRTVRTRPIPAIPAGATVRAVTPATLASVLATATPGEVLELGAGDYAPFTIDRDGAPGMPLTLRSTAGAVVTGNVDLFFRRHVRIEGLTVRGRLRFNGGTDITIVRNTIEATADGIVTLLRAEDCYIADNIVRGASLWEEAALGVSGSNVGEGILVTGPGHVIEHNRVTGFRDGISFLEDGEAEDQYSIDVVENDIDNAGDDGIEADFCAHNCRIVRNRMTNTFIAMSAQPSLGGPTYFIRNVAYNVILSAFKLQRSSVGDVLLHNTAVKNGDAFGIYTSEPVSRAYGRNNLFLGGPGGTYNGYSSGSGDVIRVESADARCDLDYDGLGSTTGTFAGRLGAARFTSLAELRAMTTERNAVAVDLTVFAATVPYPSAPFPALAAPDLRPRSGGPARDVGARLANVNDGFGGAGPDLGAYEAGAALPAYGPR